MTIGTTAKLKFTSYHASIFILTYSSYVLFHASRKTLSNVKSSMSAQWSPVDDDPTTISFLDSETWHKEPLFKSTDAARQFMGILDSCFMFAYAVGLFASGMLGDRFDPRMILSLGMISSAVTMAFFGFFSELWQLYNKAYYVIFWILTGLLQSSGWPNEVCLMGNWFGHSGRGLILGIWSTCQSVGNIVGSYLASYFLRYGYEYAFFVNSILMFFGGVIICGGLVTAPRDVGLPEPGERAKNEELQDLVGKNYKGRPPSIGVLKSLQIPGVIPYSLACAFLKMVNYSFFFWLPLYLTNNFGWTESTADQLSTWYDVGSILAGIPIGLATDLMGVRAPVLFIMLIGATFSLYGYSRSPNNKIINGVLMAITGIFIGGPTNLIGSVVSADLGRHPSIRGNTEAVATVTGIMDGTGGFGAAVGQLLVPLVSNHASWNAVFYLFIAVMILACLCLLRLAFRESKQFVSTVQNFFRQKNEKVIEMHSEKC